MMRFGRGCCRLGLLENTRATKSERCKLRHISSTLPSSLTQSVLTRISFVSYLASFASILLLAWRLRHLSESDGVSFDWVDHV